jgi:pimeloyl-ACP methyl ester carboxylesterase
MKKIAWGMGGIIFLFFLGLCGAAWYFSSILLYPGPHVCAEEHYVFCTDPSELNLAFEDVTFRTLDGLSISGWFIPGSPGKPGILMVHGRGATRREALRYVPSLHKNGFNLLLIDLRNCGASDKSFNSMGYHERKDVHAGIDYLINQRKILSAGVFGYSMGASTCIMAMSENKRIKAGVFESGFSDFDTIIAEAAKRDFGLPYFPMVPMSRFFYEWRGDLDTIDPTPLNAISTIAPRPVFIIHGTGDEEVDYSHGEALFASARHPKLLWSVADGKHTQAWQADKETAEKGIPEFFSKHLF